MPAPENGIYIETGSGYLRESVRIPTSVLVSCTDTMGAGVVGGTVLSVLWTSTVLMVESTLTSPVDVTDTSTPVDSSWRKCLPGNKAGPYAKMGMQNLFLSPIAIGFSECIILC